MNKRILLIMFVIFQAGKIRAANYAPVVKIESPRSGFNFINVEKEIKFKGKVIDLEDGELSGKSLIWTSDMDGFIGYGKSFSIKLSKGSHIIILEGTDSKHSSSRDSIFITIGPLLEIAKPVADPKLEKLKPKIIEIAKLQTRKPSGPSIVFLFVPFFGSLENLRGKLLNADPNDFAITTYIMVEGVWFSKPSTTKIKEDGTWICDITTVENDDLAIKIVSYLIPAGYKPPMISGEFWIFKEIEEKSLAKIEVIRKIRSGKVTILQELDREILAMVKLIRKKTKEGFYVLSDTGEEIIPGLMKDLREKLEEISTTLKETPEELFNKTIRQTLKEIELFKKEVDEIIARNQELKGSRK